MQLREVFADCIDHQLRRQKTGHEDDTLIRCGGAREGQDRGERDVADINLDISGSRQPAPHIQLRGRRKERARSAHKLIEREFQSLDLLKGPSQKVIHEVHHGAIEGFRVWVRLQDGPEHDVGIQHDKVELGLLGGHPRPCGALRFDLRNHVAESAGLGGDGDRGSGLSWGQGVSMMP